MEGEELLGIATSLEKHHEAFERDQAPALRRLCDAAAALVRSWSGSNIGYHALVYYNGLQPAPPGAHFSIEWGLRDDLLGDHGTRGDWLEYRPEDIRIAVERTAGNPDLAPVRVESRRLGREVENARAAIVSALTLSLAEREDALLRGSLDRAEKAVPSSVDAIRKALIPLSLHISRDQLAVGQGVKLAPHQEILAEATALNAPSKCARDLAVIARHAGSHILRRGRRAQRKILVGTNVFIGHGRSPAWRELKDFVQDRLGLPYDEFNRVPVAGVTNIARLSEMLEAAAIAFLILTAEDERTDGTSQPRMNVIHEVGLFQGRLGFTKAIVLLEEGCAEFTNIQGLGQIRFPAGRINAVFEEVRQVMEREGLIEG